MRLAQAACRKPRGLCANRNTTDGGASDLGVCAQTATHLGGHLAWGSVPKPQHPNRKQEVTCLSFVPPGSHGGCGRGRQNVPPDRAVGAMCFCETGMSTFSNVCLKVDCMVTPPPPPNLGCGPGLTSPPPQQTFDVIGLIILTPDVWRHFSNTNLRSRKSTYFLPTIRYPSICTCSFFQYISSSWFSQRPLEFPLDGGSRGTNLSRWIVVEQDVCDALSTKFPDWAVLVIGSQTYGVSR